MKNLEGKVVAIIGATGGIGDPFAEMFIKTGANVLLGSRRLSELQALRDRIDPSGKNSIALATDASKSRQVTYLLKAGLDRFKSVDLVIISVGTWRRSFANTDIIEAANNGLILSQSIIIPSWNAIFEANQFLSKHEGGLIFNLSSHVVMNDKEKNENELSGNIYYRAAKIAVENMMNSLRLVEKNGKIKFINLRPATVDTPTNRAEHPEIQDSDWEKAVQTETMFDWIIENFDNPNIPDSIYFPSELIL